ncbi:hypothetical protein [Variovorax soli]|uniref:Uncharacterized protein n=1 Tax=Variovorax soli TaxID=376815 RepID=A0ABU1NG75_9BURK|nr:hypothetical protein [Variovorax soli]MDR6537464.1 hypothetical protein [Variovorax soli]
MASILVKPRRAAMTSQVIDRMRGGGVALRACGAGMRRAVPPAVIEPCYL